MKKYLVFDFFKMATPPSEKWPPLAKLANQNPALGKNTPKFKGRVAISQGGVAISQGGVAISKLEWSTKEIPS